MGVREKQSFGAQATQSACLLTETHPINTQDSHFIGPLQIHIKQKVLIDISLTDIPNSPSQKTNNKKQSSLRSVNFTPEDVRAEQVLI